MFSKYKALQKSLQNLVIRAKEWKYIDENWEEQTGAIIIDMTWELKIKDVSIKDVSLLAPNRKADLENLLIATIQKAQTKAQEVVSEKTKDILWVDPNNLAGMLWWI